jgi:hypothetical protein
VRLSDTEKRDKRNARRRECKIEKAAEEGKLFIPRGARGAYGRKKKKKKAIC